MCGVVCVSSAAIHMKSVARVDAVGDSGCSRPTKLFTRKHLEEQKSGRSWSSRKKLATGDAAKGRELVCYRVVRVENLNPHMDGAALKEALQGVPELLKLVKGIQVDYDPKELRPVSGELFFREDAEAKKFISSVDGAEIDGYNVRLNFGILKDLPVFEEKGGPATMSTQSKIHNTAERHSRENYSRERFEVRENSERSREDRRRKDNSRSRSVSRLKDHTHKKRRSRSPVVAVKQSNIRGGDKYEVNTHHRKSNTYSSRGNSSPRENKLDQSDPFSDSVEKLRSSVEKEEKIHNEEDAELELLRKQALESMRKR